MSGIFSYNAKEVGLKAAEIRKEKGLRLVDISAISGLSIAVISKLENGMCAQIALTSALSISAALETPMDELFSPRRVEERT